MKIEECESGREGDVASNSGSGEKEDWKGKGIGTLVNRGYSGDVAGGEEKS